MKFKDFPSFKKNFEMTHPSLSLIISSEARGLARKLLPKHFVCINSDQFSKSHFIEEVNSISLFEPTRFVYVEIDSLATQECEVIVNYLKSPNPKTILILSATTLSASSKIFKEMEKSGTILNLGNEKPWDKEKDLITRTIGFAKHEGILLETLEAKKLVNQTNKDPIAIENELKKIICLIHPRKKITAEDLNMIFFEKQVPTLWQLGDALFTSSFPTLFETLHSLLDEGTSIFPILAHLKNQLRNAIITLILYQKEGMAAVQKLFPYFKEQKLQIYKAQGFKNLKEGYLEVCKTELKAKNSEGDPSLLLELLIERLCSTYSPTS